MSKVTLTIQCLISRLIINTDSLNSIAILQNDRGHIKRYGLQFGNMLRREFNKIVESYPKDIKIEFRHVKAHSGVDDSRSFVNEWCDTNAKREMWSKVNRKLKWKQTI